MANVKPIPEGYHSVTPYLVVDNAAEAIRFYERAFGATEKFRLPIAKQLPQRIKWACREVCPLR